ncbi:ribonuclease J [Dehalococcoides mccartyi]|jgi:ribonuclease J|uniref:Ribonuclease J n=1 Tax=Dehalococcoides mccartyi TaxID=61435 RepID=A0A142VAD8_9CHLR|nr:ribonuclease J [Dehalococcoides mccartyi]AII60541.1 ribonuclease J [Dehalococcoides mccartyi CG5]AMU86205.1 metallo-beta-lactamase [Dehalococcoides mccartyi]AOV99044.1 ribonuclease j2 [Dehalococcoides mccartyi]MBA2084816.1 Ribonuclease J (endonuclease and 5' exonuclease) [Dehalococcoides mccartyi]QBX63554.1 ribonuclease J [Dehalococcoides mccartyi]
MAKPKLKIVPLGGLGEIGKNMMSVEYGEDIILIDCGLMFPEEEMLGIDLVIPDISYVLENREKVRGIVITHGHEDHIGALPYILPQINVPIYCTKLTQGLISVKLKEAKLLHQTKINVIPSDGTFKLGKLKVDFYPVCHSLPDSVGLVIQTPIGAVVHSGDFKLDYTPVDGKPTNLSRLAMLGSRGVLLLMSDSTHVELPGYTPSETVVGENIDRIIGAATGRVLVTTFASLISRQQQVIDAAAKYGRKLFFAGRSMTEIHKMATDLGYLKVPEGLVCNIEQLQRVPPEKVVLMTTGSQGEPTSALVRIANRDFRHVHIMKGDTVIISASPIPGNESLVSRTIDSLFRQGAKVFYDRIAKVHVHGHASQEELKLVLNLVNPKYFVPVHGEYRHLTMHAELARTMGVAPENAFVMEDGDILELNTKSGRITGKVPSGNVYVDGLSVGDVGGVVLRNRRMLSQDGIVVAIVAINKQTGMLVGRPDIVSRGFVDPDESKAMLDASRDLIIKLLDHDGKDIPEGAMYNDVKETLNKFYYEQTKRRPMVIPVMVKV